MKIFSLFATAALAEFPLSFVIINLPFFGVYIFVNYLLYIS